MEPVLPEPTKVPKKKAVVPATKQKSSEFIESSSSSSESLDDSTTPLAASRELLPSRGKKAALSKPATARPSSSASASRTPLPARAPADRGSWRARLRHLLLPRRLAELLTLRLIQRPSHCTYRSSNARWPIVH